MRQLLLLPVNYLNFSALTYLKKNSITVNATDAWNKVQTSLGDTILMDLTPNQIKTIIMKRMDQFQKIKGDFVTFLPLLTNLSLQVEFWGFTY